MLILLIHLLFYNQHNAKTREIYIEGEGKSNEKIVKVIKEDHKMLGYLFNMVNDSPDTANDAWRLYGRNVIIVKVVDGKYKVILQVEFILKSVNVNYDITIYPHESHIKNYESLTRIENLPNQLEFDHPELSKTPYAFVDSFQFDFIKNIEILKERLQNAGEVRVPKL